MTTPQEFLSEFTKDLVAHPGDRPALIAGWAKHMEAREQAISKGIYNRFEKEMMQIGTGGLRGEILDAAKRAAGIE